MPAITNMPRLVGRLAPSGETYRSLDETLRGPSQPIQSPARPSQQPAGPSPGRAPAGPQVNVPTSGGRPNKAEFLDLVVKRFFPRGNPYARDPYKEAMKASGGDARRFLLFYDQAAQDINTQRQKLKYFSELFDANVKTPEYKTYYDRSGQPHTIDINAQRPAPTWSPDKPSIGKMSDIDKERLAGIDQKIEEVESRLNEKFLEPGRRSVLERARNKLYARRKQFLNQLGGRPATTGGPAQPRFAAPQRRATYTPPAAGQAQAAPAPPPRQQQAQPAQQGQQPLSQLAQEQLDDILRRTADYPAERKMNVVVGVASQYGSAAAQKLMDEYKAMADRLERKYGEASQAGGQQTETPATQEQQQEAVEAPPLRQGSYTRAPTEAEKQEAMRELTDMAHRFGVGPGNWKALGSLVAGIGGKVWNDYKRLIGMLGEEVGEYFAGQSEARRGLPAYGGQ